MDGQHFDRIARSLGTGRSRRSVIKGLVATWVGGVAVVKTASNADATIACLGEGQNCNVNDTSPTCCSGLTCWYTDVEGAGYCEYDQNICSDVGDSCAEFPCCFGGNCIAGVCEYDDFETCGTIDEFCGLYGKGSERVCCEGHECIERNGYQFCDPIQPTCIPEGESCGQAMLAQEGGDSGCCVDLICNDEFVCAPSPVVEICAAEGETCEELECCDDLTCLKAEDKSYFCGYPEKPEVPTKPEEPAKPEEPIVQLPDTGAGDGPTGSDWLLPAALGAAAAVVGSKLLKGEKTDA